MSSEKETPLEGEIVREPLADIGNSIETRRMFVWDTVEAQIAQSKKIRDQVLKEISIRLAAQYELTSQKIVTELDYQKQLILKQYLTDIIQVEKDLKDKLYESEAELEKGAAADRDKFYEIYDRMRADLEKWKEKPERYAKEMAIIDAQEEERMNTIRDRLKSVIEKRNAIFNQTAKVFEGAQDPEKVKSRILNFVSGIEI